MFYFDRFGVDTPPKCLHNKPISDQMTECFQIASSIAALIVFFMIMMYCLFYLIVQGFKRNSALISLVNQRKCFEAIKTVIVSTHKLLF